MHVTGCDLKSVHFRWGNTVGVEMYRSAVWQLSCSTTTKMKSLTSIVLPSMSSMGSTCSDPVAEVKLEIFFITLHTPTSKK